ncbi:MAG: mevalonate kinase [Candidatus Bilamarchaeaceae archaeon]
MGKGVGRGKVILFGEHFVVHSVPAIAAGIDNSAIVEVKKAEKNRIITKQNIVPELSLEGIQLVLDAMGIKDKYDVYLDGDLPTFGGLGSSAAFCVALVRAVAEDKGIVLTDEEVNRYAYEGEKAFHGSPSGIDNLMATYGGIIIFRKGRGESYFEKINAGKKMDIVVGFTGKLSQTKKMVELVRKFKEEDPDHWVQLAVQAADVVYRGKNAIEKGKLEEIGKLMNENQVLLSEIGVSDELNEKMVKIMLDAGALGAKLTGGGGGGCCIALARDKVAAIGITMALKKEKFESFITRIG